MEMSIAEVEYLSKQYLDEIIVIDCGSTNREMKLAKISGAKIIELGP